MPPQLLPALAALGANVHVRSRSGPRKIELERSVVEGIYYPIVRPGELITSVTFPLDNVLAPQSYVDFSWPGKDPVVVALVFCRGRLRISLLADQKLSLWITAAAPWDKDRQSELAEAAYQSFGLAASSPLSPVDGYRRRAMILRALGLLIHQG